MKGLSGIMKNAQCQTLTMKLDDQLHGPSRCDRIGVPA